MAREDAGQLPRTSLIRACGYADEEMFIGLADVPAIDSPGRLDLLELRPELTQRGRDHRHFAHARRSAGPRRNGHALRKHSRILDEGAVGKALIGGQRRDFQTAGAQRVAIAVMLCAGLADVRPALDRRAQAVCVRLTWNPHDGSRKSHAWHSLRCVVPPRMRETGLARNDARAHTLSGRLESMAGRIPQTFIDELIARADIVEIVGSRVPLKKAGREYKACCPFHDEKTASFWVSPDKQFYHCFGCGAHGTALGFLMNYEQLPFPEAVEELAGRLGLEVPHEGGGAGPPRAQEELTELLGRVAGFYQENLAGSERALSYLRGRGLDAAIAERFRIGYAPDAWNEVLRRFGATDESLRALGATGLIIERDTPRPGSEPWYDRFRDRIMFPIRDPRGRVLGFGGRVLGEGEPKYLNSPETALFHKGQELYGLHEIRLARTNLKRLVFVEGYMDVVRLHQAGVAYAVATLGTATTPEHLKRAFRLVSEVVFAFDGDRAGRAAAWRALQNALPEAREGRELRFLFLPEGEDPDSLVGREGREAFEARLATALPLSEYLAAHLREQADLAHADGRAKFVALARPLLAKIPQGVYLELLLARIAQEVGLAADRLRELLHADLAAAPEVAGADDGDALRLQSANSRRGAERGANTGRRGLVTQAIQTLLHFPATATAVPAAVLPALAEITETELGGIATLRDLLNALRAQPRRTASQLLEEWRERPEHRRLGELHAERILLDGSQAGPELLGILDRLIGQIGAERQARRYDELLRKVESGAVTAEERSEFQLLNRRTPARLP